MGIKIHPTAVVHPDARIGEGTEIGPFSVIEAGVTTGKNCWIASNVVVNTHTHLGDRVKVHPMAVLGGPPQHLKYAGEPTTLEIGDDVTIREAVTCHRGTVFGGGRTVIGNRAYIMAYAHVAHDCIVGSDCILANAVHLAGHVVLGDFVGVGGMTGITQFVRVGAHSFLGGSSLLRRDLPPFMIGKGQDFSVQGVNQVGLERRGFSSEAIRRLKNVYKIFWLQNLTVSQAIEKAIVELGSSDFQFAEPHLADQSPADPHLSQFLQFVKESKHGIAR